MNKYDEALKQIRDNDYLPLVIDLSCVLEHDNKILVYPNTLKAKIIDYLFELFEMKKRGQI